MIDVGLVSLLQSLAPGVPVEQGTISAEKADLRIWIGRTGETQETDLDGKPGLTETSFSVEVSGLDIDVVQQTASTLRHSLNGTRGAVGTDWALDVSVEDASDDYIPKSVDSDEGFHVAAFTVRFTT